MSLGTPWMLLLLPLVALAGWLMLRSRRMQREAACRLKGVAAAIERVGLTRGDRLTLAALACVVVALARPQWSPRPYDTERRGRDLVIALDISRSMLAADTFPSRLEMARITILEALPALSGQPVALVTFAGSASVRVPLTLDHGFVSYVLERATPSDEKLGSTSLQAAFEKVASAVLTDATAGGRDLIVFTDGEDHLSDLGKTAELLAQCDARVLIIGLGDPVRGARVPDAVDENQWMRHNNVEVISRLEESTLTGLARRSSNVTYFPARTRPFDLVPLYRQWIADAGDDVVVGGLRHVRYTEGYPYLLALAVVLWLASSSSRLPKMRSLILVAVLVPGCNRAIHEENEAAFRARFNQGNELRKSAEEQSDADALAERSLLVDAREEFLLAALLQPGHVETARQITTITRRLREVESAIEQQRAEETQRGEKLAETVGRLQKLSVRQKDLAQRSQRVLRRIPVPSGEDANLPDPSMAAGQLPLQEKLNQSAPPLSNEQQSVREGTASVLDRVTVQRDKLRQILTRAYGNVDHLPPTEVDPIVDLLAGAVAAQDKALAGLDPGAVNWPRANTALHAAAGRMEQALDALRSLQPPATEEQDDTMASRNAGDYDENMDGLDSDSQDGKSKPVSPGDFQEALSLRSLPIPDDTSAEIMAEEAANQQKRARQRAVRAGAKVEKNW
ncbi:MAG: VWA domain-containing protein [Thermoguttaceae bacterium]